MSRDNLGIIIVVIDSMVMIAFFFAIISIQYLIKVDVERQNNEALQTHSFAITCTRLPELTEEYPLEKLKADLWQHVVKLVEQEDHKIEKLRESPIERNSEIVDIQFAMSDYEYLENVVKIKELSVKIQKLDIKLKKHEGSDYAAAKLRKEKYQALEEIDEARENYNRELHK